jgi:hypothetical protein
MNCLRSRGLRDRWFESHSGHKCLVFALCVRFSVFVSTSWSSVQGVLPTVLDLVIEVKRKVSWRRPRPELGCRAKGAKKGALISFVILRGPRVNTLLSHDPCVCLWMASKHFCNTFARFYVLNIGVKVTPFTLLMILHWGPTHKENRWTMNYVRL